MFTLFPEGSSKDFEKEKEGVLLRNFAAAPCRGSSCILNTTKQKFGQKWGAHALKSTPGFHKKKTVQLPDLRPSRVHSTGWRYEDTQTNKSLNHDGWGLPKKTGARNLGFSSSGILA